MSRYACISKFGCLNSSQLNNNPLTYCLLDGMESGFLHGGIGNRLLSKDSKQCQQFMSDYCSRNWDDKCEFMSNDNSVFVGSMAGDNCNQILRGINFTKGDILIRNTADRKYLVEMSPNCTLVAEPFDPTVSSSPMITWWKSNCPDQPCVGLYKVNPDEIDSDPVMNKILSKPHIAIDILINIYNTMNKDGSYEKLKGTKIYDFFESEQFKNITKYAKKLKEEQSPLCPNLKCWI